MPKQVKRKGKKKRKNTASSKRWTAYKTEEDKLVRVKKFCPRCGPGVFLAKHKNRLYCGRCHYTEFIKEEK